ncbi:ABC transporter ATP-binding protein [Atopobium sp. oral taxon 810]|uniref:ABC transporter ATP-binding protein n=1 Tax=Atopobium sp. oral taxon 810 TaxID=712158 RepID=UPI000397D6D0|nr:ABC transporter ATP-binding protein [Atopobium sp. oral taxon 810]ERI05263.1 putative bacitracin ABC transporter, ATP-binding protein BcrA [Atopobium sp. oral taxon 810 str. F0209]
MTELTIATHALTKSYSGTRVVDSIELRVPEGAVYGFLGPNGAGKSTTMKMILGLVHPSSGEVDVLGEHMGRKNRLEVLAHVGSLIENPSCYRHLTARENLDIIRRLKGLPVSSIDEALETVGLADTGKKLAGQFSLGMKQRLGLAAALLGNPKLVLLDEPTNGLDPEGIHEMRALVRMLPQTHGTTVLVSSHLLSEVEQMADHVGIISRGQMVWQGSLKELRACAKRQLAFRTTDDQRASMLLGATKQDGWLLAPFADDVTVARLSLALARAGIGVVRIEERSESIEDLFLAFTEGRSL